MVVADRELQTEREAREHVERALAACKDKLAGAALGPASPSRLQARVLALEEALAAAQRAVGLRNAAVEDLARRRREDQAAHASALQAASAGFSPSAAEAEVRCAALEAKLAESEDSRRESEEVSRGARRAALGLGC